MVDKTVTAQEEGQSGVSLLSRSRFGKPSLQQEKEQFTTVAITTARINNSNKLKQKRN